MKINKKEERRKKSNNKEEETLERDTQLIRIPLQVYSVVRGTVNVFISNGTTSANEILIEKDFGEFAEENFLSKVRNITINKNLTRI